MNLDASLFPPDIEYRMNENYGDETKFRKQVKVLIGVEEFAVILRLS